MRCEGPEHHIRQAQRCPSGCIFDGKGKHLLHFCWIPSAIRVKSRLLIWLPFPSSESSVVLQFIRYVLCTRLPHHCRSASVTWNVPCPYTPCASRLLSHVPSFSRLEYLSRNRLCVLSVNFPWPSLSLSCGVALITLLSALSSHLTQPAFISIHHILQ